MTNRQWFAIALSVLFILLVAIIGGYACVLVGKVSDILQSPAVTSEIDIAGKLLIEGQTKGGVPVTIEINHIHGDINSKILDLILLAVND